MSLEQPLNTVPSNACTVEGRSIVSISVQFAKALLPKVMSPALPSLNVTFLRATHPWNALDPIFVTDAGILREVIAIPLNALFPISPILMFSSNTRLESLD